MGKGGGGGGEELRGAHFNLVDVGRPDFGVLLQFLNVLNAKVADADTPRLLLVEKLLEGQPHFLSLLGPAVGAMDEEEVDVARVEVELLHALAALGVALVEGVAGLEDLGGDEDIAAGHLGLLHGLADLDLVAVELRRVDVAVPALEGAEAGLDAEVGRGFVDAEAELRDLD